MIPRLERQFFITIRNYCNTRVNVDMFKTPKHTLNKQHFHLKRLKKNQYPTLGRVSIQVRNPLQPIGEWNSRKISCRF